MAIRHDLISNAKPMAALEEIKRSFTEQIRNLLQEDVAKSDIKELLRPSDELLKKVYNSTFETCFSEAYTTL